MPLPRIKIRERAANYHCTSRTVLRQHLLGAEEREVLTGIIRRVAAFCNVEITDKSILSNHFHILCHVGFERECVGDAELMRRYRCLYKPGRTPANMPEPDQMEKTLSRGGPAAEEWRAKLFKRMNDVSVFMKEIKQRFTLWYHRKHGTSGTLWGGRFHSTVVEGSPWALRIVAVYIGLNPLRAGLCQDPADYRWCGYAEAMAGVGEARAGICRTMGVGPESWEEALRGYRMCLFGKGGIPRGGKGLAIDREKVLEKLDSQGEVSAEELLRCRVRYFTDGGIIGSRHFVSEAYENAVGTVAAARRKSRPARLRGADWGGLHALRDLRRDVYS